MWRGWPAPRPQSGPGCVAIAVASWACSWPLQRLARNPPEAVIVQPMSPAELVRSAILLRAAVPGIERRAESLRTSLATLARNAQPDGRASRPAA